MRNAFVRHISSSECDTREKAERTVAAELSAFKNLAQLSLGACRCCWVASKLDLLRR